MENHCSEPCSTSCDEVLRAIYHYMDAECDPVQTRKIKQHLAECSECLHEYGIEQEVKALVGRCCGSPAPEGLEDRLRAKLATLGEESASNTL